jgi:hypothetical protein
MSIGYGVLLLNQMAAWFPNSKEVHTLGTQPAAGLLVMIGLMAMEFGRGAGFPAISGAAKQCLEN